MLYGAIPSEAAVIVLLNTLCNLLYCGTVLLCFIFLPHGYVLLATTLVTVLVGPALALVVLAVLGGIVVAFALYPLTSVLFLWTVFFLTSHCAQVLGKSLGLDVDKDGNVDLMDLLHYLATKPLGRAVGLPRLYRLLKESSLNPFDQINRRLDELQQSTRSLGDIIGSLATTQQQPNHDDGNHHHPKHVGKDE
jgi:energy-coupling factor transporter transmembrane protein EcfT